MEIYTIDKVVYTLPVTYKLKDYQNYPVGGGFYEQELLKVRHSDVHHIEKILRKKGNRLRLKWLGFDSSHNTWENAPEVQKS